MRNRARIVLSAIGMIPSPAMAQSQPLQPTGQWVVNYDEAQCFAARNFGTIENPLYLVIKVPPMGEVVQLAILREGSALRAEQMAGTITFDARDPIKISLLEYKPGKDGMRTLTANIPEDQTGSLRQASVVRIKTGGLAESFALTSMPALMDTMRDCVADLRRVWNVRNKEDGRPELQKYAKGDLRGLFSSNDYPTQAIQEGGDGSVKVMMLISETGKVADCSVVETSGIPALDVQACSVIMHRANFRPAVGSDGKPAKSAYLQQITWRLL